MKIMSKNPQMVRHCCDFFHEMENHVGISIQSTDNQE